MRFSGLGKPMRREELGIGLDITASQATLITISLLCNAECCLKILAVYHVTPFCFRQPLGHWSNIDDVALRSKFPLRWLRHRRRSVTSVQTPQTSPWAKTCPVMTQSVGRPDALCLCWCMTRSNETHAALESLAHRDPHELVT